jgi:hypothetical protein
LRSERTIDRRRAVRRTPTSDEPVSQIRLRAGRQLSVIDVSDTGLLAEGDMRLLPGTHVDVHLVTPDGRLLIRSRVVRAFVCYVSAARIDYRGALAFDRTVPTASIGYPIPEAVDGRAGGQGNPYPDPATSPPAAPDDASSS